MELCVVDSPKSAKENLSINEACFEAVKQKRYDRIVRIYLFSSPTVILGRTQEAWDVRDPSCEVTRRFTGGSAVYVDEHSIGYSIFGRFDGINTNESIPIHIPYKEITDKVAETLRSYGLYVGMELHWGLTLKGKVIAGHAKRYSDRTYEVHGLMRCKRWDMDVLKATLRLRKKGTYGKKSYIVIDDQVFDLEGKIADIPHSSITITRDEYDELSAAPGLDEYGIQKGELIERLAKSLSRYGASQLPKDITDRAATHKALYESSEDGFKRAMGHCFVDFSE